MVFGEVVREADLEDLVEERVVRVFARAGDQRVNVQALGNGRRVLECDVSLRSIENLS